MPPKPTVTSKPKPAATKGVNAAERTIVRSAERTSVNAQAAIEQGIKQVKLRTLDNRTLRVAAYANFYPIVYKDPKDGKTLRGLDVDLIRGFCKATGMVPKFTQVKHFSQTWRSVDANDADIGIGGIGMDDWRNQSGLEWSMPYYRVMRTLVYRLSDPIHLFPRDVTGKIRGTMGSIGMIDAMNRLEDVGKDHLIDDTWKSTDQQDLRDLLSGKIQGLMRGSFVGRALVEKHPKQLGMTKPWSASGKLDETFAFPCHRGSGIAALMNYYLAHITATGELRRLKRKYHIETRWG